MVMVLYGQNVSLSGLVSMLHAWHREEAPVIVEGSIYFASQTFAIVGEMLSSGVKCSHMRAYGESAYQLSFRRIDKLLTFYHTRSVAPYFTMRKFFSLIPIPASGCPVGQSIQQEMIGQFAIRLYPLDCE